MTSFLLSQRPGPSPRTGELTVGSAFIPLVGLSAVIAVYYIDLSQVKSLESLYNLS